MSAPHIFTHVDACAKSFITLTDTLSNSPIYSAQVDPNSIENEFGRFKIWTGNVAAHHKGRRSLEYRLRDADHLKKEIQTVLTDLLSSLVDGEA